MSLRDFLTESDRIEGIYREPTGAALTSARKFLDLLSVTLRDLVDLQSSIAPGKPLRDGVGMNVRVGEYQAPPGGPGVTSSLGSWRRRWWPPFRRWSTRRRHG